MKNVLLLFLWSWSTVCVGQTILDNNPPRIKWYKVSTPNFNVLFPLGFDAQAQRMANTLEHIRKAEASSLGGVPRKISILLQNQSSVSNGFVSMFPRRSEFYTMPAQNYNFSGTNDWLNLLASHEYRHIVQYHHATRGFNKFLFYLFGNPTFSGMAHAAAPDWFWEGDAVATETAFTPGGRGRIPNFGLLLRTNYLEGRTFNYHKLYLRSYKHNIPNHYVLGYHMVSFLRDRTNDPQIWEKITARSWSVPFLPFAFSNAIKKESGYYVTGLYNAMAEELTKEWRAQVDTLELTAFERINERTSTAYTDYQYPQPQPDGSVLVRKEGIGDIERYVFIKDGKEKPAFTPGFINDAGMLSSHKQIVVWNEFGYDPRWRVRNFSLIKAYDHQTRSSFILSDRKARYGSAALSPDCQFVATVRSDEYYRHALVILSYPEGNVLKVFQNNENDFFSMPRWSDDGRTIVFLRLSSKGKTISMVDVKSGQTRNVLPISNENVGHPVMHGDMVLFNSPVGGIDNVHAVDIHSGERYQVTTSKYGAYNPAVSLDGKSVYYNEQSRDGLDVARIPFDRSSWMAYRAEPIVRSYYQRLIDQEGVPNLFDSIPQTSYPISKYARWKRVINPFSWGAFVQNDLATVDFGITSRDLLSTLNLTAGYTFDLNERTGLWRTGLSYQGIFPIIDLEYTQGSRKVDEGLATTTIIRGQDTTRVRNNMIFSWKEQNVSVGLRIPLLLTNSKYSRTLTFQNAVGYTRVQDFSNDFMEDRIFPTLIRNDTVFQGFRFLQYVGNGDLIYNYTSLSGSRLLKRSARDIVSRWGQAFNIRFYSTPFGGDYTGGVVSGSVYLYFPGLFKHHGFYGYVTAQRMLSTTESSRTDNVYFFRNTVPLPRGQSVTRFQTLMTYSANYTFPIWCPDVAMGPILNLQRFRGNLFADYALGHHSMFRGDNLAYSTVGAELFLDFNIMRFRPQFDIGIRYAYGMSPSTSNIELVVGTFNF